MGERFDVRHGDRFQRPDGGCLCAWRRAASKQAMKREALCEKRGAFFVVLTRSLLRNPLNGRKIY
ncbi:hypothetical protein, partial [uncultured Dubosiella sp.]|uniref:hypothetical protein n=1 Tax=uncultured Dubosiella sp. TaxID=1937011 RepID=UPI0027317F97